MARNYDGDSGDAASFWLVGLCVGAVGGIALALLTAPKPGSELRSDIEEQAKTVPGRVNSLLDESLDLYASALNYCQLLMEEQTIRVKRAVAAGKLAAAKKREELELGSSSIMPFQHR